MATDFDIKDPFEDPDHIDRIDRNLEACEHCKKVIRKAQQAGLPVDDTIREFEDTEKKLRAIRSVMPQR